MRKVELIIEGSSKMFFESSRNENVYIHNCTKGNYTYIKENVEIWGRCYLKGVCFVLNWRGEYNVKAKIKG